MKKPKILLSGNTNLQYYVDAVAEAGGEPVAQYLPEVSTDYDGLILCGGNDIDPKYYQQEINGAVNIDSARDTREFDLLRAFVEAKKPILGICRGYQLINVFFGGSLHQHIPQAELHTNKQDFYLAHNITAMENSVLHRLYGENFSVNSCHHQAVDRLGENLVATSLWENSCVESYEHTTLPIYGVQFHPERMCVTQARPDTVDGLKIFTWFLSLCK